jgi:hypothetical protein
MVHQLYAVVAVGFNRGKLEVLNYLVDDLVSR